MTDEANAIERLKGVFVALRLSNALRCPSPMIHRILFSSGYEEMASEDKEAVRGGRGRRYD